jgi:Arrestin (or S-antigen), N-terminal domain/Arrestin (or S-antigen), C-terminal domain
VPSTVKGKHGKVRYSVEANLQTGWEFDVYSKCSFTVIRFEDLSYRKDLMVPLSDEISTTFCCWSCKSKPLKLQASIPFAGYVPGQSVRVTIRINNRCGFDVYRTVISLKKVFTFIIVG